MMKMVNKLNNYFMEDKEIITVLNHNDLNELKDNQIVVDLNDGNGYKITIEKYE